jgi:hypothetical protein
MKTRTSSSAERMGVTLGRIWCRVRWQEARLIRWGADKGVSASFANFLLWTIKAVVIGALLYVAMWLTIVLLIAVAAAAILVRGARDSRQQEWLPKPADHRDELFYDPLSYNDDPDPRFKDE